jgi:hypothetical protein
MNPSTISRGSGVLREGLAKRFPREHRALDALRKSFNAGQSRKIT